MICCCALLAHRQIHLRKYLASSSNPWWHVQCHQQSLARSNHRLSQALVASEVGTPILTWCCSHHVTKLTAEMGCIRNPYRLTYLVHSLIGRDQKLFGQCHASNSDVLAQRVISRHSDESIDIAVAEV